MLKKLLLLSLVLCCVNFVSAQDMSLEELKAKKAELEATQKVKADEAAALQPEIDALKTKIDIISGWTTGVSGLVGLDFGKSSKWVSNPNPTSSSSALAIGITGYANKEAKKYFWRNKLIINKAWQDIDILQGEDDKLFDQGTIDILNVSSLAGYKLTEKIAISALAELNTSMANFLQPGTFDIGVGITWTPIPKLVVVIHPLNYHIAWSADGDTDSQGSIGAKLRADYQDDFNFAGRKVSWSSTLTSFIPYNDKQTSLPVINQYGKYIDASGAIVADKANAATREAGLFEYTWLNTFSFQVWKGIGVGLTLGLRNAEFEFEDLQTFYTVGLSYTL